MLVWTWTRTTLWFCDFFPQVWFDLPNSWQGWWTNRQASRQAYCCFTLWESWGLWNCCNLSCFRIYLLQFLLLTIWHVSLLTESRARCIGPSYINCICELCPKAYPSQVIWWSCWRADTRLCWDEEERKLPRQ